MEKEFFRIKVSKYVKNKDFYVVRPASLNNPKDNSVMFVTEPYINKIDAFEKCVNCLVFWPKNIKVPADISSVHAICVVENPRNGYCNFFKENGITNYPSIDNYDVINGSIISKGAVIGGNCTILPGAYIGADVKIGNDCYIGSGTRIVGSVSIGNRVVIRENSVIGADGLSTDRDDYGIALTMPQFGGVVIEDDVQIGALTVIARGAIDNTIVKRGSKIDNSTFISHNVIIGEDSFIVGETIMFGSSSTGEKVLISGNSTIRNGLHIGSEATVGMGSVVINNVNNKAIVKGNPAKNR